MATKLEFTITGAPQGRYRLFVDHFLLTERSFRFQSITEISALDLSDGEHNVKLEWIQASNKPSYEIKIDGNVLEHQDEIDAVHAYFLVNTQKED